MNNYHICLPIVENTNEKIEEKLNRCIQENCEYIEIRIDYIENIELFYQYFKHKTYPKKIIGTLRTKNEGGQLEVTSLQYLEILSKLVKMNLFDYIDIEYRYKEVVNQINQIKRKEIEIILSMHNFEETKENHLIIKDIDEMNKENVSILKYAVMPNIKEDVNRFIELMHELKDKYTKPIICMSMGELGIRSRVEIEYTGSILTFASLDKASAPGQIQIQTLIEKMEEV